MNKKKLIEGVDFTWIELDGIKFRLFTKKFLLDRGYCCNNGCTNCPYKKK